MLSEYLDHKKLDACELYPFKLKSYDMSNSIHLGYYYPKYNFIRINIQEYEWRDFQRLEEQSSIRFHCLGIQSIEQQFLPYTSKSV